ncbi:ATP-binding protein [Streptomyces macrosporus]|uniref:ATP-binding protein n=1 Tax=Streptomyces macrosporus TaxID=44032 RepID=UPI0031D2988E
MTTEIPSSENTHPFPEPLREFEMRFTSTPRGARLARRLASQRLDAWGHPYGTTVNDTVTLVVAELTANAIRHGHVPGRDFHLRLTAHPGHLRVEVADTRAERMPPVEVTTPDSDSETGRGLWLVSRLAASWGAVPRPDGPGKVVWAEIRS